MGTVTGAKENYLHYEDTGGTGRPLVLVHSWPRTASPGRTRSAHSPPPATG